MESENDSDDEDSDSSIAFSASDDESQDRTKDKSALHDSNSASQGTLKINATTKGIILIRESCQPLWILLDENVDDSRRIACAFYPDSGEGVWSGPGAQPTISGANSCNWYIKRLPENPECNKIHSHITYRGEYHFPLTSMVARLIEIESDLSRSPFFLPVDSISTT